jgi:hypothetical protein
MRIFFDRRQFQEIVFFGIKEEHGILPGLAARLEAFEKPFSNKANLHAADLSITTAAKA